VSRRSGLALTLGALLWIGAVVVAVVLGGVQGPPQFAPLPPTVCPVTTIGVDSTLAYDRDDRQRAATVAAVRSLLAPQVVRDTLLWSQVEPVEGARDWSVPDSIVGRLRAAGIEPLLIVLGSPPWANGVPASVPEHDLYVPARGRRLSVWLERYSNFVAAAVRRYRRAVRRWEIWNEPNLAQYWRPGPDPVAYRQVYETLRATILRVEPDAQVAVGGLGDLAVASPPDISGLAFLRDLTRTHPPLGSVAVHAYATGDHAPDAHVAGENNFDDINRVHAQLLAEREPASIWVTEFGWSSSATGAQLQAHDVETALRMLEDRYSFVTVATYFLDHDLPPEFFQGLLDRRLRPKPAALVFRAYAKRETARCTARAHPSRS
jgi:hypothetical protein